MNTPRNQDLGPTQLQGIVLRTFPSRDADIMLRVLTPSQGKISILAKHSRGSKKHFGGGVDLFDIGSFELTYGRGPTPLLKSFRSTTRLDGVRTNLDKMVLCSLLTETADYLSIEDSPECDDFDILCANLREIEEAKDLRDLLSITFQGLSRLMQNSGFLDESFGGRGSAKKLFDLIHTVETSSERKLESKDAVFQILRRLTS